jgi:hypothetical protein
MLRLDDNDDVDSEDIFRSMAVALVEHRNYFEIENIADKNVEFLIGQRPPREIFYQKTLLFEPSLPKAVHLRRCTCHRLCFGSSATIKCYSCAIYDSTRTGFTSF